MQFAPITDVSFRNYVYCPLCEGAYDIDFDVKIKSMIDGGIVNCLETGIVYKKYGKVLFDCPKCEIECSSDVKIRKVVIRKEGI